MISSSDILAISSAHTPIYRRFMIASGFAIAALAMTSMPAPAHQAPSGWAYDPVCCSNRDCRPETSEVKATSLGWFVTSTGETIRYGDHRIHESKDGEFHRCPIKKNAADPGMTRCLYVPPMGL